MRDPVLVATDGGDEAAHALRFAAAYASVNDLTVEVVSVASRVGDLPLPLPHREELEAAHVRNVADAVRRHLREVVGAMDWPVHVSHGRPAPGICVTARQRSARLVVLGLTPTAGGVSDTALELLHLAEKPVLAARSGRLPEHAVVGVDFQAACLETARQALGMLQPGGVAHLVHVKPSMDFPAASVWDWDRRYAGAVERRFEQLVGELETDGLEVTREARCGDPAGELMAAAEERGADLLAVGSDGYICNRRVVVGRVAREVLTRFRGTTLATPVTTLADDDVTEMATEEPVRSPR